MLLAIQQTHVHPSILVAVNTGSAVMDITVLEGVTPLRLTPSTHASPVLCVRMLTTRFQIPLAFSVTIPTSTEIPPSMTGLWNRGRLSILHLTARLQLPSSSPKPVAVPFYPQPDTCITVKSQLDYKPAAGQVSLPHSSQCLALKMRLIGNSLAIRRPPARPIIFGRESFLHKPLV